jgi:hypothetical protein
MRAASHLGHADRTVSSTRSATVSSPSQCKHCSPLVRRTFPARPSHTAPHAMQCNERGLEFTLRRLAGDGQHVMCIPSLARVYSDLRSRKVPAEAAVLGQNHPNGGCISPLGAMRLDVREAEEPLAIMRPWPTYTVRMDGAAAQKPTVKRRG